MNNRVIIVGASSGLGRRLAELYAEEGWKVGVIARREYLLKQLSEKFPDKISYIQADIRKDDIIDKLKELIDKINGSDLIILSASIVKFNPGFSPEHELETVSTNVKGFTNVLNFSYSYFKNQGYGQIAAITSFAATRGNKMAPAYNASKAFQSNYLEGLRIKAKYENKKITVTELVPGYFDSEMGKGDRLFWVASVDKAAKQVQKAIRRKKAKVFITKRWRLIHLVLKFLPIFIYDPVVNGSWKLKRK